MFTFVVWSVGLIILGHMAFFNFAVTVAAFSKHWLLGLLITAVSIVGWIVLLMMIF